MTTICSSRDQFAHELDGHLAMMQNPEAKYTFGNAILDFTVLGTLYQIGGDFAHLARTDRAYTCLQQNSHFVKGTLEYTAAKTAALVANERLDKQISVASKLVYLGSLASLLGLAYNPLSLVGCITSGAYFMLRAGFNANEHSSDARVHSLRNQLA